MTSEEILARRARGMDQGAKESIVKTYVLSLYMYQVWDDDKQEAFTVSEEGEEMAKYLMKQEEWQEYGKEVERGLKEWEKGHETYH